MLLYICIVEGQVKKYALPLQQKLVRLLIPLLLGDFIPQSWTGPKKF